MKSRSCWEEELWLCNIYLATSSSGVAASAYFENRSEGQGMELEGHEGRPGQAQAT